MFPSNKELVSEQHKSPQLQHSNMGINQSSKIAPTPQPPLITSKSNMIKEPAGEEKSLPTFTTKAVSGSNTSPLDSTKNLMNSDRGKANYSIVITKQGDILSKIIYKEYGFINDNIYEMIKSANPEIQDIDQIKIDQTIVLPKLDIDSQIVELAPDIYSFHIASFRSYSRVKNYLTNLIENNYPIYVIPVKGFGKTTWYRIMVGQFTKRDDAIKFAKTIKKPF